jgi:hypothetical protein
MAEGTFCAEHILGWTRLMNTKQDTVTLCGPAVPSNTSGACCHCRDCGQLHQLERRHTSTWLHGVTPKKTVTVNLLQENHKIRVPFVGVSYKVKKNKDFYGDVINPPDPVPHIYEIRHSSSFHKVTVQREFPACQLSHISAVLEGVNDFLPHCRYFLTDMGQVRCSRSPRNAAEQIQLSGKSVQSKAIYT